MTNLEIIANAAVENKLYTKEEVEAILETGLTLPIHTFAAWKKLGYMVKKGEHAKIVTKLWKMTSKKEEVEQDDQTVEVEEYKHMYLVKSFLFTKDQVERVALS